MIAAGGTDTIRVVVAGQLPRQAHNAPLHLFSAAPGLVEFVGGAYRRRSDNTSSLLGQLFDRFRVEGFALPFTMEDFKRQYMKEHFKDLMPQERLELLQTLPPEECLAGLSPEQVLASLSADQIQQLRDQLSADRPTRPRKPRRKK
jgi:hypothetical protein